LSTFRLVVEVSSSRRSLGLTKRARQRVDRCPNGVSTLRRGHCRWPRAANGSTEPALDLARDQQEDHHHEGQKDGGDRIVATNEDPQGAQEPDRRRRGEAADLAGAADNGARSQEADAGDDLAGDSGGIAGEVCQLQDQVAGGHIGRRAGAHQNTCPDADRTAMLLPLDAENRPGDKGRKKMWQETEEPAAQSRQLFHQCLFILRRDRNSFPETPL